MFAIGEIVIYSRTEVCRVEDIREMPFPGEPNAEYYVLKPLTEENIGGNTLYVPVTAGEDRIRQAFTAEELNDMLEKSTDQFRWIENAMIRRKEFNEILSRNNPEELMGLLRAMNILRCRKLAEGRKLGESDEKYLAAAQKRLFPLFRYAMHMEWEDFLAMSAWQEE